MRVAELTGISGAMFAVLADGSPARFLNERVAYNHIPYGRLPPPFQNGISPYRATIMMAEDTRWSIFNSGIPPPIFGRGASGCGKQPSARPGPP
ncbi:MAG: hypothetical protein IS632_00145 [Thaumarchaeota archaeon]|nr:hypothetical protein [Nitrososphaerota archaeon]